jgi:multiple antibiotic resistance protein
MDVGFFVQALIGLFAVVDPFSAAALFALMTAANSAEERHAMALRAAVVTFTVLVAFLLLGQAILHFFSISLAAFQIAGGLVLGLMSMDSLKAFHTGVRTTSSEKSEGIAKPDVSVTPVGVPLLAGPGAISLVVLYAARYPGPLGQGALVVVVGVVSVLAWLILRGGARMVALVGQTGINVLSRLIGLLVLAIAVQFVVEGVAQIWGEHVASGIPLPR